MTNPDNVGGLPAKWLAEADADEKRAGYETAEAITLRRVAAELCRAAPAGGDEKVARFGHHPDPAIDFEIEVESLQSRLFNAKHGLAKVGTQPETVGAVSAAIARAMEFRVGGDESAVRAKAMLRTLQSDSAPAGSGEVDLMVRQLDERAKWFREENGYDATLLRQCAALLRKLSPAGSGEVVTDEMVADACKAYRALAKNRLPNWHRKGMRLALGAALAHVARDAIRVDWLEDSARVGFELDAGTDDPVASIVFATPANSLRDLRAAIDAAMEADNE